MGLTRTDIERIQQEAGEEGIPDLSYEVIQPKDDEEEEIDYKELDIHHNRADHTFWQDLDITRLQAPHASLLGAKFSYSRLEEAYLGWADMRNVVIKHCWMKHASLLQARLKGAFFTDTMLAHVNLGASQMNEVRMRCCKAMDAVFAGALCGEMSLFMCDLQRADFQHTNLTDAFFTNCDLTAANLSHANLTNAVFDGDCLVTQVDLAYADLTGLCINEEQLRSANLLHLWQAFEKICAMRSHEALGYYRENVLLKELPYSLPAFLGMALVPNGPAHCIEQFTHGLLSKKKKDGTVDGRYSDVPVRTILLEWIDTWLRQ